MARRNVGIGAIKNRNLAQARFKDKSEEMASEQLNKLSKQLESFKSYLEDFATKHKTEIRKNAEFRSQFQQMCASIGVDPLASGKGFWAEMLGVGDFYYELGVQIIEVCLATNYRNGGLIGIEELRLRVMKSRGKKSQEISNEDLLCAIKKLKALGNGFSIIPMKGQTLVQSVPGELTMDHTMALQLADEDGQLTISKLCSDLGWEEERALRVIEYLLKEGLAWVDEQASDERHYWIPGLFPLCISSS